MLRTRQPDDASEDTVPAYHRQPRGTVARRMSNPVLCGVHPQDDFTTAHLETGYRPRRRSELVATTPKLDIRKIFETLKDEWLEDTADASSTSDIVKHPAHLSIIGLGPAVLPLILKEAEQGQGHWFWALRAIARQDVAEDADTIDEARHAWLRWGRWEGLR